MYVLVNVGNLCNFKCVYCPVSFGKEYLEKQGGSSKLSMADFNRIVDQVKDIGHIRSFDFEIFGEPFAYPLLMDFVKIAVNARVSDRVKITTNGSLVTPDKYEAICDSKLDYLKFSIYGVTEGQHKQITKSSVLLSKVRDNIVGLKKYRDERGLKKPFIYVKYLHTSTEDDIKFMEMFGGLGDLVDIETAHNWNDPEGVNLSKIPAKEMMATEYMQNDTSGSCAYPFYFVTINSDMTVAPCAADWDKQLILGNLRTQTLREIWNGNPYKELRRKHLMNDMKGMVCDKCTFKGVHPDKPVRNLMLATYMWACHFTRSNIKLCFGWRKPTHFKGQYGDSIAPKLD